jgi:hypothetical protein
MTRVRNPENTGAHLPKGRRLSTSFVGWKYRVGQQFLIPSRLARAVRSIAKSTRLEVIHRRSGRDAIGVSSDRESTPIRAVLRILGVGR